MFGNPVRPGHYIAAIVAVSCLAALTVFGTILYFTTDGRTTEDVVRAHKRDDLSGTVSDAKPPHYGSYRHSAVAADAAYCSKVGMDILVAKKGSAVDAAIAIMLCVGVLNGHSSGIGGGHFMTIYDYAKNSSNEREVVTVLARERAPLAASRDMYVNHSTASLIGGQAIAVPGEMLGFYREWQKFGKVPWRQLFLPAIRLCRDGFPINGALGRAIQKGGEKINADEDMKQTFTKQDGSLLKPGDKLKRPLLARTLEVLSHDPLAFYNRESQLAKDIVADIQDKGGLITLDDLERYYVYQKPPLTIQLTNGNYTVFSPRPPASGAVYAYIMNILDGYNFRPSDYSEIDRKALSYHRMVEAMKFAYARRSGLGDEEFVPNIQQLIANLTSEEYGDETRAKISDMKTHNISYYHPDFDFAVDSGTSHASVLSPDGSAVSVTSTINGYLGSGIMGSRTGIIFNNEMDDFSTPGTINLFGVPSSPANFIEPGKMPMSSMCPTIILDNKTGTVKMVTGASGGTKITTATSFVTTHALWFKLKLDKATDIPRMHHQLFPHRVEVEEEFDQRTIAEFEKKGHKVVSAKSAAVVQSVIKDVHGNHFHVYAVSDLRKQASAQPYGY